MTRANRRAWYEGPVFTYKGSSRTISVDVTGSSWAIRDKPPAKDVVQVLGEYGKRAGVRILDFGAGSWLNYTRLAHEEWPGIDLTAVEYPEAFREDAGPIRDELRDDVTFWSPKDLLRKSGRFDLILLVNVLNVIPEEAHRAEIFGVLAKRLLPTGKLLVYQRKWVEGENPPGALPYGDGWMIPQKYHGYFTYRAGTGAGWFNERAHAADLVPTAAPKLSSANTLLKMWVRGIG